MGKLCDPLVSGSRIDCDCGRVLDRSLLEVARTKLKAVE
jgi:hypothetical protein